MSAPNRQLKISRYDVVLSNNHRMERAKGQDLTAEQEGELDNEYFGSDPFSYFASRISNLLEAAQSPPLDLRDGLAAQFAKEIGQSDWTEVLAHSDSDRELQVALDCYALRHSAAEALVRLYLAAAQHRSAGGSFWQKATSTPTQTKELVTQTKSFLSGDQGAPFWEMVTHLEAQRLVRKEGGSLSEATLTGLNKAVDTSYRWLERACYLLTDEEMNLNVANNKIKHGLAVRTRDDHLAIFIPATPDDGGNVPLSAITGPSAIPVINTVSVDVLSKPKAEAAKPGWELTTLSLRPATLLAETWLMARTHAALFHVAASRHFGATHPVGAAPYRPPVTGPTPESLLRQHTVGYRWPLTAGHGGGDPRPVIMGLWNGHVPFDWDGRPGRQAVITDG